MYRRTKFVFLFLLYGWDGSGTGKCLSAVILVSIYLLNSIIIGLCNLQLFFLNICIRMLSFIESHHVESALREDLVILDKLVSSHMLLTQQSRESKTMHRI